MSRSPLLPPPLLSQYLGHFLPDKFIKHGNVIKVQHLPVRTALTQTDELQSKHADLSSCTFVK